MGNIPQYPMMSPGFYSPGQMVFNNNPELSQLIATFGGGLLNSMVGPGHFMPHMMPTQQLVDQFALRNHQNNVRQAALNIAGDNTANVSSRFLALRSAFTDSAPTDLNKAQADQMAGIVNNPMAKILLGQFLGPENAEAFLHGSRGDVSALGAAISRTGYFRDNPLGGGRMNADALTSYTRAVFSELYEPSGDLDEIIEQARDDDVNVQKKARRRLKRAAIAGPNRERLTDDQVDATTEIVEDAEVVNRLTALPEAKERVNTLYKKYVQGGKETDTVKQAETLVKFERAIKEADVLKERESTIGGLAKRAEMVPVHEMHGFMAGQAGQIQEHMFQRGLLPKSLGRMDADERVKTINDYVNTAPLSENETRKLAREMAEKSLLDKRNNSADAMEYRSDTSVARRSAIIDSLESAFTQKIETAQAEIKKTATGAAGALKSDELAQLPGVAELAATTDGKRTADALKKYTGAVSAIRDIFGDNGNPNAPLPALLAALEGLTGGAVGSMRPQQIESTLRQMQSIAKEAGIGFEQMAAISTQVDAQAAQLGLTPADAMRLKPAAMAAAKVMQDTGAFSTPIYGQLDRGASMARAGELITAGAASGNARAMGALESIYRADPTRFADDSEIKRALDAARDEKGDGTYTFIDPNTNQPVTRNIRDLLGEYGESAVLGMLERGGVSRSEFAAQYNNPTNLQFVSPTFGYLTQRASIVQELQTGAIGGQLSARIDDQNALAGLTPEAASTAKYAAGKAVAGLILDTAGLPPEDQRKEIQKQAQSQIEQQLIASGFDEQEAARLAPLISTPVQDSPFLNELVGRANTLYAHRTGGEHMAEAAKRHGQQRDTKTAQEMARHEDIQRMRAAAGIRYETAPAQRFSDFLLELGNTGEKFTTTGLLDALIPQTTDRQVFRDFTQGSEASIDALGDLQRESMVSRQDIDAAVEAAKQNPAQGGVELKRLAGIPANVRLVQEDELKTRTTDALKTQTAADLEKLYEKYAGEKITTDLQGDANKDKLIAALEQQMAARPDRKIEMRRELLRGTDVIGIEEAAAGAARNINTVKEGATFRNGQRIEYADLARYREQIAAGIIKGDNDSIGTASLATLKAYGSSISADEQEKVTQALTTRGDTGANQLRALKDDAAFLRNDPNRDKIFAHYEALQKYAGEGLGRVTGLDVIPDEKDFFPPDSQERVAEIIAKAIKEAFYPGSTNTGANNTPPTPAQQQQQPSQPPPRQPRRGRRPPVRPTGLQSATRVSMAPEALPDAEQIDDEIAQETLQATNDETLMRANGVSSANIQTDSLSQQPTFAAGPPRPDAPAGAERAASVTGPLAQTVPDISTGLRQQKQTTQSAYALPASMQTVNAAQYSAAASPTTASQPAVNLKGTLAITGLQEAILNAYGSQVVDTGGAPVVLEPTNTGRTAAPSGR